MSLMQEPDEELVPTHGLLMNTEDFERLVDGTSPYYYEMVGGVVYNMAPPSEAHERIAAQIFRGFDEQIGLSGPCRAMLNQRVRVLGYQPSVQPDVLVTCNLADWKNRPARGARVQSPLIVVEILSPSTQKFDRGEKFTRYTECPACEVYLLVEQDLPRIEVYRRANEWRPEVYTSGVITLDQLDLELSFEDIYRGVF